MTLEKLAKYTKELKVLYVEDEKVVREATSMILLNLFQDIILCEDGEQGYDTFIKNQDSIDLIITDIMMPKLNGIDMIDKIRDINKDVPVIIFSAYEDKNNHINSVKLNISYYLNKPIELDTFKDIVAKVVKKIVIQKIHNEFNS